MKRLVTVLLIAGTLSVAPSAFAVPTIFLSDGGTSVTVTDGGLGDANPVVGVVTFVGPVGANWIVNVSTGISKPILGNAVQPSLDLNSVDISLGAGTLTIRWSDASFGPTSGMTAAIGGTSNTGGTLRYNTYGDPANLLCSSGPCPGPLTSQFFSSAAFSGTSASPTAALGSPFSLTQEIVITHTERGATSFDASFEAVPEPGTLLLLGSGLTALALRRRRRS